MRHMLGNLSPNYFERTKRYMMLRASRQGTDLTVSGTPPLSLPNSLGKPLKAWSVDVLPYQEGTGGPSPDNVRPIHGTDKLTITTAGKNLIDLPDTTMQAAGYVYALHNVWNLPAGDYTLQYETSDSSSLVSIAIETTDGDKQIGSGLAPFTVTGNIKGIRWYTSGAATYSKIMLNFGSTALPYEPYNGSQTVLTLPQTVYTGTIGSEGGESRSGELIVDGVNNYIETSGNYCNVKPYGIEASPVVQGGWRCSTFPTNTTYIGYNDTYKFIYFVKNAISAIGETDEERNAYCQAHPIQIIYRKATSESIAISTPTIPTPTGTATTWATAEDGTVESMEVTYVGKA